MRVFFALKPSPTVEEVLANMANTSASRFGGKPTRQETIHLTLAFLGEVAAERVTDLIEVARTVRAVPFDIGIDCLGYWRHNQLLWAGFSTTQRPLLVLAGVLRTALGEAEFLPIRDIGNFTPHVTLVRKCAMENASGILETTRRIDWHCSNFVLLASHFSTTSTTIAPSYETLFEFKFD